MKTVLRTIIVIILLALAYIYSGIFNVAADKPDNPVFAWVLETTRERSIETRADKVVLPADLASVSIEEGFKHYHHTCEQCHGAPGLAPSGIREGLNPEPPELHRKSEDLSPATVFWVVKHGIKMSGMASFGKTHSDKELLAIVAFVKKLPDISEAEYNKLAQKEERQKKRRDPVGDDLQRFETQIKPDKRR